MAQGYETFADAKRVAQTLANKTGHNQEVWRGSPTAKRFKFQTHETSDRSKRLMIVKPNDEDCGQAMRGMCACGQRRGHFYDDDPNN